MNMRLKIYTALLILTSLLGYLEWGTDHKMFLFEMETDILQKGWSEPTSVLHPFVIIPLAGQLMLLITLFQKIPSKKLIWIGMIAIGLLFLFLLYIGIAGKNWQIALCALPFLGISVLTTIALRQQ